MYISDKAVIKPRSLHNIYKNTKEAIMKWSNTEQMPKIVILSLDELAAYGKYDAVTDTVFYIPEIGKPDFSLKTYIEYHEMWHRKQAERFRDKGWKITKENYGKYIEELCSDCKNRIDDLGITKYNVNQISIYAYDKFMMERYDEVEAEYMTIVKRRQQN